MLYRLPILALVTAVAMTAGACAPTMNGAGAGGYRAVNGETVVRVKNHNWSDITVYAVRLGMRFRLGMVTSMSEQTFAVPSSLLNGQSDFRILADPIGSSHTYLTDAILVSPGQMIDLTLENNINLSSYAVWDVRP